MVDMVFLVFIGFLYLPPAWKVSLRPEKFSKRCFFGGGSVRCFSSLKTPRNLNGDREEANSPKTPFWTTVSPHDAFAAANPHKFHSTSSTAHADHPSHAKAV